jgi:hypothetical protein
MATELTVSAETRARHEAGQTTLSVDEARAHFRGALLALERRNPEGAEARAATTLEYVDQLVRDTDANVPDVFSALATGLETALVTTSFTPEWFTDRDRALLDVRTAVENLRRVLRRVDRQAADASADAIDAAITDALHEGPPLATLKLDPSSVRQSVKGAHAGGPRRKPGSTWTELALRRAGLTKEAARDLLHVVGLRAQRGS